MRVTLNPGYLRLETRIKRFLVVLSREVNKTSILKGSGYLSFIGNLSEDDKILANHLSAVDPLIDKFRSPYQECIIESLNAYLKAFTEGEVPDTLKLMSASYKERLLKTHGDNLEALWDEADPEILLPGDLFEIWERSGQNSPPLVRFLDRHAADFPGHSIEFYSYFDKEVFRVFNVEELKKFV